MKRIYLFCIIFILVVPFKIFTQGIYFSEPTSSSVYHIPYGGSVGISYNFFHANDLVVYTYYAKLTYPDGQQSNWQNGEIGGWWVTEGGTYQIQGKAWVASIFYPGNPYWAYREPFSFSVIADPPDPNITYNVNFQNNFIGVGNMGNINVSGNSYTSPTNNFTVAQGTTINATAINQTLNYIDYFFSNWSNGSPTATTTFNPLANATYTANFIGKPNFANRNLTFVGAPGNPRNPTKVQLSWNEHPNINVEQYKIWRKVKHNGVMGNSYLIATVNRGTTTYTDEDYAYTSSYTDDLILYDVKAYYTIEGTSSDDNYVTVFGVLDLVPEYNKTKIDAIVTVTENSLNNFPNPFNPSTIIRYQIVKAGHVTIKVYDALGREVANLVDKQQPSGKYSVNFNASDLSSGIYLYRITANDFMAVKKMILLR